FLRFGVHRLDLNCGSTALNRPDCIVGAAAEFYQANHDQAGRHQELAIRCGEELERYNDSHYADGSAPSRWPSHPSPWEARTHHKECPMWHDILNRFLQRTRVFRPDRTRFYAPNLMLLEDRTLPSTFTVMNLADHGAGSLRDAVQAANQNPGADLIQ